MTAPADRKRIRPEERRRRSLVELLVVVGLSVAIYALTRSSGLFHRVDGRLELHENAAFDDLLFSLPFALLLLGIYAVRRYRDAVAETAHATAAERDLERTTEEFRSLFDYHPRAVFSLGPDRRYRRLNAAAEELSGYSEDELRTRVFPALKTSVDTDQVLAAYDRALVDRETTRLDVTIVRKDGQRREVDAMMLPIVVGDEAVGVYVIARDATDDNRMRRELAQALADAEAANEAKTLFLANVSHELRTPLTSVIGAVEVLDDDETLDDLQRRLVGMVSRNGQALLRLVDDLLDVTRMEAGQLAVEDVPFDLRDLLDQAVALLGPSAERKGLDLSLLMVAPPPRTVIGDPQRLAQVLANLLGNAVKFTEAGKIELEVTWQRRSEATLDTCFRVHDTGIGICPEDLDRLFGRFVQADPTATRRYGGAGLGLAISRQLVELMGGAVSVESEPGQGSTFTARVPLRLPEHG